MPTPDHQELLLVTIESLRKVRLKELLEDLKQRDWHGRDTIQFGNDSHAKRVAQVDADGVIVNSSIVTTFGPLDKAYEEAALYEQATNALLAKKATIGQSVLYALWQFYIKGYAQYRGEYNPQDFGLWARDRLQDDSDNGYIVKLVRVVECLLQPVYKRESEGKPFQLSTGESLTVAKLLNQPKITSKLITGSLTFPTLKTDEEREALLDSIMFNRVKEFQEKADALQGKGVKVKVRYSVWQTTAGRYIAKTEEMDNEQLRVFEEALRLVGEVQIST